MRNEALRDLVTNVDWYLRHHWATVAGHILSHKPCYVRLQSVIGREASSTTMPILPVQTADRLVARIGGVQYAMSCLILLSRMNRCNDKCSKALSSWSPDKPDSIQLLLNGWNTGYSGRKIRTLPDQDLAGHKLLKPLDSAVDYPFGPRHIACWKNICLRAVMSPWG